MFQKSEFHNLSICENHRISNEVAYFPTGDSIIMKTNQNTHEITTTSTYSIVMKL